MTWTPKWFDCSNLALSILFQLSHRSSSSFVVSSWSQDALLAAGNATLRRRAMASSADIADAGGVDPDLPPVCDAFLVFFDFDVVASFVSRRPTTTSRRDLIRPSR